MKISFNKKDNMKTLCIIVILLITIIGLYFIYEYNYGTWICYQENIPHPPKGTRVWNQAISYQIEITRTGKIRGGGAGKEKLDKNELKELKKIVNKIEKR